MPLPIQSGMGISHTPTTAALVYRKNIAKIALQLIKHWAERTARLNLG